MKKQKSQPPKRKSDYCATN